VISGEETTSKSPEAGRSNGLMRWLLPGATTFAAVLATGIWYLHRPLSPPRITGYTQITHDGRLKYLAGTDGSRLYFNQSSPISIAQVGITGGEIAQIPIAV